MKKPIGPVSSIPLILTAVDRMKSQHEITKFIKKKQYSPMKELMEGGREVHNSMSSHGV